MVPITLHFPCRSDALRAQSWLGDGLVVATLEATFHSPDRPWSLVLAVDADPADGVSAPTSTVESLHRAAVLFGGEVDESRMDDDSSVYHG